MKKVALNILASLIFTGLFSQSLSVELGSVPATAIDQCTGKVWVNVTGGQAPYSFYWNNEATTTYQENLCLGTYSVTVTDVLDATAVAEVVFTTSSQIIIPLNGYESIMPSLYGHCDGIVSVYAYSGIEPYDYQIFDANSGLLLYSLASSNELCAGEYYAVVTDANGGIYFHTFSIANEFIRPVQGQFPGVFPINQTAYFSVAGEPPFSVVITSPNSTPQNYTIETSMELISFMPTFSEYYNVQLTDNLGHVDQELFCAYDQMNIMNINVSDASNGCNGSVISPNPLNISMNFETGPSTYQIIYLENETLCPGEYMVMVQDIVCPGVMNIVPITISGPVFDYPEVEVSSSNTIYNLCTGMAWVETNGGTEPYDYSWINYSNATDFINNLCSGNLFVKVTDAANVWSYGYTYIESDLPETVPGDTLSASQEECISNITDFYIYSYTVNPSNVVVTWAIEHEGMISYIEVIYNYVITLPGVYNVELILNCQGGKSIVYIMNELEIELVAVEKIRLNDVSIYPNPVEDNLVVSYTEDVINLEILSVTGAIICSHKANGTKMHFDVSEFSNGVYIIHFTKKDGSSFIQRFVK
jgi:hypothetical protein